MVAPGGRVVAPSGRRGPRYWPTRASSPSERVTETRFAATCTPSWSLKTAAVSGWPTADSKPAWTRRRASSRESSFTSTVAGKPASMLKEKALSSFIGCSSLKVMSSLRVIVPSCCCQHLGGASFRKLREPSDLGIQALINSLFPSCLTPAVHKAGWAALLIFCPFWAIHQIQIIFLYSVYCPKGQYLSKSCLAFTIFLNLSRVVMQNKKPHLRGFLFLNYPDFYDPQDMQTFGASSCGFGGSDLATFVLSIVNLIASLAGLDLK